MESDIYEYICIHIMLNGHVVTHGSYSNGVVMKAGPLEQPMSDEMDYCEMFNFTLGSLQLNNSKYKEK